jgi:hypothetical protein
MFRAMVYAPTEERYNSAKATFCERSKKRSKTLVTYFTKNWDSCSSMWSNYGRRIRFSGGNTTTNRIEASWNQFKQLLGKKTSIDKCVRVVIQQQVAVMRQIVSSLTQFEVNPPLTTGLHRALRPLANVLSPYCLARMLRQWDLHVLRDGRWNWLLEGGVYSASPGNSAVSVTWTDTRCSCDCLFFVSTLLPCQHIFNVLVRHREEVAVQVAQLDKRWSMLEAKSIEPILQSSVSHLAAVRQNCRNIIEEAAGAAPVRLPPEARRIQYVKLARGQSSNRAVLSLCEKYNIVHAELLPVIESLENLASIRFYEVFADLRSVIAAFTDKWELHAVVSDDGSTTDDELVDAALVGLVDGREDDGQDGQPEVDNGDDLAGRQAAGASDGRDGRDLELEHGGSDTHIGRRASDIGDGLHGRDRQLGHGSGDAHVNRDDVNANGGLVGQDLKLGRDGGDDHTGRRIIDTDEGRDGRNQRLGHDGGGALAGHQALYDSDGRTFRVPVRGVNEVISCHTHGHVDEDDDWAYEPDAELEPDHATVRAPCGDIAPILNAGTLITDPQPVDSVSDALQGTDHCDLRSTRPRFRIPSSADLIDPSQVSLPELHLSDLSQDLLRKSDALLRRADEVLGESDVQYRLVSNKVEKNPPSRERVSTGRRSPDAQLPQQRGKGAISQLAKAMKHRASELERLARGESESDEFESDWESSESDASSDPDFQHEERVDQVAQLRSASARISLIQLPRPNASSSAAKRRGPRRAAIETTSDCPIRIDQLMMWALNTSVIGRVEGVLKQYPVLFTDPFLAQKNPTVVLQRARSHQLLYTFAIPRVLVARVNSAMQQWLEEQDVLDVDEDDGSVSNIPVAFIASELAPLSR